MAGFKIAEGYLEIDADTDAAMADVRKFFAEVDGELKAEEKSFAKSGARSGKSYVEGLERSAADIDHAVKAIANRAFNAAQEEGRRRNILSGLLGGGRGGHGANPFSLKALLPNPSLLARAFSSLKSGFSSAGSLFGDLFKGGKSLFKNISSGIADAFSTGLEQAKSIWESASKAFSQIGGIASGIGGGAQAAGMALLIPAALGLAGALSQLAAAVLVLPAAIGTLAAALVPLVIGFKALGDVFKVGLTSDMKEFNEGLKSLNPNARTLAKEIHTIAPALKAIKTTIGENFLGQLVGSFAKLGGTLLPVLNGGLGKVATELGRFVRLFLGLLSAPDTLRTLNNLFDTTARLVHVIAEPLINLFGGFFDLLNAGLPWVERFTGVLARGLQSAADWLAKISEPGGKFTGWMERAWDIGKKLWNVLKGIGEFAFTILNSLGDEGTDTLRGMGDAIAKVNEYLKSKDGQETLHNLGVLVHWAGNAIVFLIDSTTGAYRALNAFFNFIRGIGPFFSKLGSDIADIARAIGHWFAGLWDDITGGISAAASAVGDFFVGIGRWFSDAWDAVVSFGAGIVQWFVDLPGKIGSFLAAIPAQVAGFFSTLFDSFFYGIGYLAGLLVRFWIVDLPNWIMQGWNWAIQATRTAITAVANFVTGLPGMVWNGLQSLASVIGGAVEAAWNWAKDATLKAILDLTAWANALPGRIWGILSALGDAIGGWFSRAWTRARDATVSGYNSVMTWLNNLPGAVKNALSNAGSWLYNAGKDALRGLVNGLQDSLGWAVDQAKRAASAIKRGFLDALGINSPSRVMRMEVGRWVLPGVMQGIEDTKPRFEQYLGVTADMVAGSMRPVVNVAAPSVSVGGTTLIADLGEGIRQVVPIAVMKAPKVVATAANVGFRQQAAWTNTGRTVITGS